MLNAVQAAGKIACDINILGADLVALSAHKLGGPKGVGALIKREERLHFADPLIRGGGQERGARAGTENVAGIAGFGAAAAAAAAALADESRRIAALRDGSRPIFGRFRPMRSSSGRSPRGCPTRRCSRFPA